MANPGPESHQFSTIPRVSPPEHIRTQIIEAIARGDYPAGSLLPSERALCESFGVSRVSVREALAGLAALGIVEIQQGKGAIVQDNPTGDYATPFGEYLDLYRRELIELLKVRRALDELAAAEAAINADKELCEQMVAAADDFDRSAAGDPPDLKEIARCDEVFHLSVAKTSAGQLLPALIGELNGVLRHSRQLTLSQPGQIERSVAEHRLIANAILDGEPELARQAAGKHIVHVVEQLTEAG